jgi:hypothetical protein
MYVQYVMAYTFAILLGTQQTTSILSIVYHEH